MELRKLLPEQGMPSIRIVPKPSLKISPGKAGCKRGEGSTGIEHATDINVKTRCRLGALTAMERFHTHTKGRDYNKMVA